MNQSEIEFIHHLRQSSPYMARHRGKTLVIYLPGSLISHPETLLEFAKDCLLLKNLGIQPILTLGATEQIDQACLESGYTWQTHLGQRITEGQHLTLFQQTLGWVRSQLEAAFSQASAEQHSPITLVSGNWAIAQPKGVIDGIDFQHTGRLRKINQAAIKATLDAPQIALLTPLSYSLTGEVFNLNTLELAFALSQQLQVDKLMLYQPSERMAKLPKSMSLTEALNAPLPNPLSSHLQNYAQGIPRIHLMDEMQPGSILLELFSRDGLGSLIFTDRYHHIRPAKIDDVAGILNVIAPLEKKGILVKRSRETLELEIENFIVLTLDQSIIGCAALYPIDQTTAELACLAVDHDYQGQDFGRELMQNIEQLARQAHFSRLCLLTTHTQHWFIEHGFQPATLQDLPPARQQLYNYQRQSKVLIKPLQLQ